MKKVWYNMNNKFSNRKDGGDNDMKVILLTDDDDATFSRLKEKIRDKTYIVVDSTLSNKNNEIAYLTESIHGFSKSNGYEIMLVKFSGKEEVRQELGDENSEMIISVSGNPNSAYFIENLENVFLKLI